MLLKEGNYLVYNWNPVHEWVQSVLYVWGIPHPWIQSAVNQNCRKRAVVSVLNICEWFLLSLFSNPFTVPAICMTSPPYQAALVRGRQHAQEGMCRTCKRRCLCKRHTCPCVLASGDPGSNLTCLLTVMIFLHMAKHNNWHSIITY